MVSFLNAFRIQIHHNAFMNVKRVFKEICDFGAQNQS